MEDLGQHFLDDKTVLAESIKQANISKDDIILEIGAGTGNLTKHLSKTTAREIIATEIDERFTSTLQKIQGIHLIIGNGLKAAKELDYTKIVSNLPFHICEPLFHVIIIKEPERCVFITGKRFFELLQEKTKIGIGTRAIYKIEKIMNISKDKFKPEPRTDSVLFVMKKKKEQTEKEEIIKEILQQEDKTLKKALIYAYKRVYKLNNKEAKEKLTNIPKSVLDKRVMHLSNRQFGSLIQNLK